MGLFTNKKKGKAPHTWYPDILHWREGDKIFCWNIAKAIGYLKAKPQDYSKYSNGVQDVYGKADFVYKSVDGQGNIYLEHDENIVQFEFYRLVKVATNESLKSRKLEADMENSEKYMELMHTFQQAFDELQEEDNHPKRLGETSSKSTKLSS
ncbi:MAG TPA: hypothetical protein VKY45_07895 [Marinilabiliaceae bacterium]|nr:hypothetical protein [Marinilabiliaceae bacterium]